LLKRHSAVVTRRKYSAESYLLRSYNQEMPPGGRQPQNPGRAHNCSIIDAGRATSAAPTYFKSKRIVALETEDDGPLKFIDGGIGFNDPSWELLEDARIREGNMNCVKLVLSLGTGYKPRLRDEIRSVWGRNQLSNRVRQGQQVREAATSTYGIQRQMQTWRDASPGRTYAKWTGGERVGGLPLDEFKSRRFREMRRWVARYMEEAAVRRELHTIATMLVVRRRERFRDRDRWERYSLCTRIPCPLSECLATNPGMFSRRREAREHVQGTHPGIFTNPVQLIDNIEAVPPQVRRGPW